MGSEKMAAVAEIINGIDAGLRERADPQQAPAMAAYLRNRFPFFGVSAPVRRSLVIHALRGAGEVGPSELLDIARHFFSLPEREFHLAGIDALVAKKNIFDESFVRKHAKFFLTTHSWWDSVDALRPAIGFHVAQEPLLETVMFEWIRSENIWLRRSAIIHQLTLKANTDTDRLGALCSIVATDSEFFVSKSVGWALRDYSATNPTWVAQFVSKHPELTALARREALRRLKQCDA